MAAPELLFFTDVESTGIRQIDGRPGAVLEFAWTITDPAGEQITPLNSVFTALPTEPGQDIEDEEAAQYFPAHIVDGNDFGSPPPDDLEPTAETARWWCGSYPSQFVRDMHDRSGLTLEWVRADRLRPLSIISSWPELERLLIGDLLDAGWYDRPKASVQLAGDGVAHYEHTFLPTMAPRVFADERFHYRTHDVSQILNGLATATGGQTPGNVGRLIEAHAADLGDRTDLRRGQWGHVRLGPRFDATDRGNVYGGVRMEIGPRIGWAKPTGVPHRAAADVARSLMAHRLLPRLVP